jgi:hypothetical protein
MSFSSRRRNYLLTPHRRDGLVEWKEQRLVISQLTALTVLIPNANFGIFCISVWCW